VVVAILAEKPSVARDIAAVVGATKKGNGCLHGNGHVVTWAIGHLCTLAEPHEMDPRWKAWRRDHLPIIPATWPLVVIPENRAQFDTVKRILHDERVESVVCATDAGREGELIFRYIYEVAACHKPVRRMWVSSLTADAIRAGLQDARDGRDYDPLGNAARGRAQADWLVGMNLSRAYTLAHDDLFSVGRVQTPTLAMLVGREKEIRAFVPQDYAEVHTTFLPQPPPVEGPTSYRGTWFRPVEGKPTAEAVRETARLPADGKEAREIVDRVTRAGSGVIESLDRQTRRFPPPPLYDLTELQRHANRLYGFSAQHTLDTAQKLYEQRKLLSYPRTDSRHLSASVAATLPKVVAAIQGRYPGLVAPGTGTSPLGKRFVDDAKITDHHAIIPTAVDPAGESLTPDEQRLYDLVCRRLLSAWHDNHVDCVTTVVTAVPPPDQRTGGSVVDRFHTSGTAVVEVGWKALDVVTRKERGPRKGPDEEGSDTDDQELPRGLEQGQEPAADQPRVATKRTRPPRRFTEATLLTAMETAGKTLDDKELSDAMKERGLGTPATRAAIIETLLQRKYVTRDGKALQATDKGVRLVDVVHPDVKSPAMTGEWERQLRQVERGGLDLPTFMRGIEDYVREVVGRVRSDQLPETESRLGRPQPGPGPSAPSQPPTEPGNVTLLPRPPLGTPAEILSQVFGHASFRPHQEQVCRAVMAGQDGLLVMPTGSGKSLCYQLPGLALRGTTLVVSPLIALMEDQVGKLKALGLRAERIHSGRDRGSSRAACQDYLAGNLDYLFIAPERLAVPGFPEMLARRKPVLVAIDEAHCISMWGHDFRPEYRMLGGRLPQIRGGPVLAMTATATARVQADITSQLGLKQARRFIHGFRRDNIAIEVVEVGKPDRLSVCRRLLADESRRPAIVYAPTRREAEEVAGGLGVGRSAAYHAGMRADDRERVQADFLGGRLDVIVATIAFGMGVDKPDIRTVLHLALPETVENYYQEVGRAGRDRLPSRAVLLHSYVDRRNHEYFHKLNYPPVETLRAIYLVLNDDGIGRQDLLRILPRPLDADVFERALEKLWIHGGARVDSDDTVRVGSGDWEPSYVAQSEHRLAQQQLMVRFTQTRRCRMEQLVRHFGDDADRGGPCGQCDNCAQEACVVLATRPPTAGEEKAMRQVLDALQGAPSLASGALFRDLFASTSTTRDTYESLLTGLARAKLLDVRDEVFEKDGRPVPYQRLSLTPEGQRALASGAALGVLLPAASGAAPGGAPSSPRAGTTRKRPKSPPPELPAAPSPVVEMLKAWRLREAKRHGVPAFRVLSDKTLALVAAARPADDEELRTVKGVGATFLKKYGTSLLAALRTQR
jgi:DNA topoisomerase-3